MLRFFLLIVLVLCLICSAEAQDTSRVRQHLNSLCAANMHGRGYVQGGDSLAAIFIKQKMEAAGLQPLTSLNGSYFQPFGMKINTFPGAMKLTMNGQTLTPGRDYIIKAASGSGRGTARIVYLDSATLRDGQKVKKFFKQRLSKKAVMFRQQDYPAITGLPDSFLKKMYRSRVLLETNEGLTATLADYQYPLPVLALRADSLKNRLKGRKPTKVSWQTEAHLKNHRTQNVIAVVPGRKHPDKYIMVSAHYDHVGQMGKDVYFPGANDNASGTAMLLEMAHYFKQNPPDYNILFVAFAAEEAGLIGSKYFTENPPVPLKNIELMLNLDLEGTGGGLMVVNGRVFTELYQRLDSLNKQENWLPKLRSRGKAAISDHYFLTEAGVEALYVYTLEPGPGYHDIYDRPEKIRLTGFTPVFKLLTTFIESTP